jgi:hypothetical protein
MIIPMHRDEPKKNLVKTMLPRKSSRAPAVLTTPALGEVVSISLFVAFSAGPN